MIWKGVLWTVVKVILSNKLFYSQEVAKWSAMPNSPSMYGMAVPSCPPLVMCCPHKGAAPQPGRQQPWGGLIGVTWYMGCFFPADPKHHPLLITSLRELSSSWSVAQTSSYQETLSHSWPIAFLSLWRRLPTGRQCSKPQLHDWACCQHTQGGVRHSEGPSSCLYIWLHEYIRQLSPLLPSASSAAALLRKPWPSHSLESDHSELATVLTSVGGAGNPPFFLPKPCSCLSLAWPHRRTDYQTAYSRTKPICVLSNCLWRSFIALPQVVAEAVAGGDVLLSTQASPSQHQQLLAVSFGLPSTLSSCPHLVIIFHRRLSFSLSHGSCIFPGITTSSAIHFQSSRSSWGWVMWEAVGVQRLPGNCWSHIQWVKERPAMISLACLACWDPHTQDLMSHCSLSAYRMPDL